MNKRKGGARRRLPAARRRPRAKPEAILLVWPTGSGKTPLGLALERMGFARRRAFHFDFGAELRRIAARKRAPRGLSARDMSVIRESLRTGALLENENFPIAARVLDLYRRKHRMKPDDILVLNGLPRHEGQARDLARTVRVIGVVHLDASLATVRERIRRDAGGDRAGRADDSLPEVRRKFAAFRKRTTPLLDHYRRLGARIIRLKVGPETEAWELMAELPAGAWGACARPRRVSRPRPQR